MAPLKGTTTNAGMSTEATHTPGAYQRLRSQGMASNARPSRLRSLALWGAGLAMATAAAQAPAVANTPDKEGWITIPTRVDEFKVRYRPMGCKDGICTIEVAGLTRDEAISSELIDCKAMKIRNATSPLTSGWKAIATGTVDMEMAKAVCR